MKYLLDSHTHTIASGHAYCTVLEMARAAADRGLELLCITDHAPAMEGTTCRDYFANLGVIDRELFGVQILMGVELNLLDTEGTVDLDEPLLRRTDMAIVSLHTKCIPTGGAAEGYTNGLLQAMKNPYVNIIGHPDDGRYPLDYPTLVRAAADAGDAAGGQQQLPHPRRLPGSTARSTALRCSGSVKSGGPRGGGEQRPLCLLRGQPPVRRRPLPGSGLPRGAGHEPGQRPLSSPS